MMKQLFVVLGLCLLASCSHPSSESAPKPMSIDAQIQQLEEQKAMLDSRADFAGREAYRIQFQDWMGYRYALERQQKLQAEANALGQQIDALKAKRGKKL